MSEYTEIFPTCPQCLNESLIMTESMGKNWFKCDYCNFQTEISIQMVESEH